MKKKVLLLGITLCSSAPSDAGLFDFVSTAVGGVKNLVTTGGKACTPCGTPYNVRCMRSNGVAGEFVPFPINSCFAPLEMQCRPTPELIDQARQYCRGIGQILNEQAATKEETKRGLVDSQIKSATKAVNGLLPAVTAIGGVAASIVTRDGAAAEAGLQASASLAASQNDAKSIKNDAKSLELKKEKLQMKKEMQSSMNTPPSVMQTPVNVMQIPLNPHPFVMPLSVSAQRPVVQPVAEFNANTAQFQ